MRISLLLFFAGIMVACGRKNKSEPVPIPSDNIAQFTIYGETNSVKTYGNSGTQTNIECEASREKGITIIAYSFDPIDPVKISNIWQIRDRISANNIDQVF